MYLSNKNIFNVFNYILNNYSISPKRCDFKDVWLYLRLQYYSNSSARVICTLGKGQKIFNSICYKRFLNVADSSSIVCNPPWIKFAFLYIKIPKSQIYSKALKSLQTLFKNTEFPLEMSYLQKKESSIQVGYKKYIPGSWSHQLYKWPPGYTMHLPSPHL